MIILNLIDWCDYTNKIHIFMTYETNTNGIVIFHNNERLCRYWLIIQFLAENITYVRFGIINFFKKILP